ncbi:MAG: ABC transporter substrate-binding protein [Pseudomonadota bacterium]
MSDLNRRAVMSTFLATALIPAFATSVDALTEARARALVDQVVKEINGVIASGRALSAMIKDFERIFSRYADVNLIARTTLGQDARRATNSQLRAFTNAFRGYIARKYGRRFREFEGGTIEVTGVKKVKSWHEVRARVKLRGSSPFRVLFLVSDRSGRDLFFDLLIEGASLRITERAEITALLDRNRGDINKTIADLKKIG